MGIAPTGISAQCPPNETEGKALQRVTQKGEQKQNPFLAISYKLISVVLFMLMAVLIKASSDEVPLLEAVFFRSFFAIPIIMAWVIWQGDWHRATRVTNFRGHLWRGLIGSGGMICAFTALSLLPLPEVTALGYAAPLLTVIFGAWLLQERLRAFRIAAVILGFIGVIIVLLPKFSIEGEESLWGNVAALGAMAALISACLRALSQIHIRRLTRTEESSAIVFYFSLIASTIGLLSLPFGWVMPSPSALICLIASGLIGGIAQLLLTTAYRYADTSLLAPFDYSSLLFALFFGYVVFGDIPTRELYFGAPLVILAGIIIIWREHYLGMQRAEERTKLTPEG